MNQVSAPYKVVSNDSFQGGYSKNKTLVMKAHDLGTYSYIYELNLYVSNITFYSVVMYRINAFVCINLIVNVNINFRVKTFFL